MTKAKAVLKRKWPVKTTPPVNMGANYKKKSKKSWTNAQDEASDRRAGIKNNSSEDLRLDRMRGVKDKKKNKVVKKVKKATGAIKHSGSFEGKSNTLGHGGRAAQMRARGVPGGVIGAIARSEGAAPGGPNYHGKKKKLTKNKTKK